MGEADTAYRCDIIVATWNKLDYIKGCVESILRHTDVRSRLIIVDNASEEDARAYLRGLRSSGMVEIKLIFNDKNLGPGKARNMALRDIRADYVCFADSDVIVTPGWLSAMINTAESNPKIGMVNPSSNNFSQAPPQGMSIDEYTMTLRPFKTGYIEVGHCISFCMLIKQEVARKIGFLDEEYILALYEDTDYSMKASRAGYLCVIAKAAYVWHHGHGSTGRVKKINVIAQKNKERFYKKWGRPLRVMWCCGRGVEDEDFRRALADAVRLAREGNFVYMFVREQKKFEREEIFRASGLIEHANVHIRLCGKKGFKWFCLWRILIKRKKRYNLAIADNKDTVSLLDRFKFFHKAEVVKTGDFVIMRDLARKLKFG